MAVATVFFLLACGIIVIQASPFDANANPNVNILSHRRNINANTNTNIIGRRNINANANTNILARRNINSNANTNILARRNVDTEPLDVVDAGWEDEEEAVPVPLEPMRRRVEPSIASVAVAAGNAAFEVMKEYSAEMSRSAGRAVVDSVLKTLRRRLEDPLSRRNYNSNANTNIIGGGGRYGGGTVPLYPARPSHPSGLALAHGSDGQALGLSSGPGGYALAHGGRYADEEEVDDEDADVTKEGEEDDVENKETTVRRGFWGYPNFLWGGNSNANANTNMLNAWPRNSRRNVNANTNTNIIGHKRY